MRLAVIGMVFLLLLSGVGYYLVFVHYDNGDEVIRSYLDHVVAGDLASLEGLYHKEYPFLDHLLLEEAFNRFGEAFRLTEIELGPIQETIKTRTQALYTFTLIYHSSLFPPLSVSASLELIKQGFGPFRVVFADVFPLPETGVKASYRTTRQTPERGNIMDRNNQLLAGFGTAVSIGVQPDRITDPERLLSYFQEYLGLHPDYVLRTYTSPGVQGHWFVPLALVSEARYREIDPILRPIPGVFFRRQETRIYPLEKSTAHVTGYMGEVSAEQMAQFPERDYEGGERVGRSGLELSAEDILRGQVGYRFSVEIPNEGHIVISELPTLHGQDLLVTLDSTWQKKAYEVLEGYRGSFVILDARTGEILVMVSTPSFDPNEFSVGITSSRWLELTSDPHRPLFHRAVSGRYPPGSVFKVFTAAIALDLGIFHPESLFEDTGSLRVQGNLVRNFEGQVFSVHTLHDAIVYSINTTIAQVGLQLGAGVFREYFSRLQLDALFDVMLPLNKSQVGQPERSGVALAWSAIGQDQVLMTPLALATLFTAFANEGLLPRVHLEFGRPLDSGFEVLEIDTAFAISNMLLDVVERGTGKQAAVEGLSLRGKTGTAEIGGSANTHALFCGTADVEGKRLAFAMIVEEEGVGGQVAAPLVGEFFRWLKNAN